MTITNNILRIDVSEHGAELQSLMMHHREYLWHGNPIFWGRRAPILFPIVGKVWNDNIIADGDSYNLSQHGFARDMDFKVIGRGDTSLFFQLESDEETLKKYPYRFELTVAYHLNKNKLYITYDVVNSGAETMYFQVGAHPAFMLPDKNLDGGNFFTLFSDKEGNKTLDSLVISSLGEKGCLSPEKKEMKLEQGRLTISSDLFSKDALVIENKQVQRVDLNNNKGEKILSMTFDAPVLGLWSPVGKQAPFVCIEPWYGRCDRVGFSDDISQKDWINKLEPAKNFTMEFCVEIY